MKKIRVVNDYKGSIFFICNRYLIKYLNLIITKKNQIRGNHYHKKNSHYIYIAKGKIKYFELKNNKIFSKIIKKNQIVFTMKRIPHAIISLNTSHIIEFGNIKLNKKFYKSDTVEKKFITLKNL